MYLDDDVDGVVTDMVTLLISLIIGALLDRFKLTIGQSTSMIDGMARDGPTCPRTSSRNGVHVKEAHRRWRLCGTCDVPRATDNVVFVAVVDSCCRIRRLTGRKVPRASFSTDPRSTVRRLRQLPLPPRASEHLLTYWRSYTRPKKLSSIPRKHPFSGQSRRLPRCSHANASDRTNDNGTEKD